MYRNNDLEGQQRETVLIEVTLDLGAMSCGILGYLRSADSRCSFLGGSLTFLRKDSDHVRNYWTQYHSCTFVETSNPML